MRTQRQRGFTLVELLVVAALIGLISAMAVPAYKHVLFKTKRSKMLHHLKLIGEDELLHQRDHGTYYPEGLGFGGFSYAMEIYMPGEPMHLQGQDLTLPAGSRHYVYYIYRFEPFYTEPIIYAYAHTFYGNDLDGDPHPDLWIKVGSGPPQPMYDDRDDRYTPVRW